MDPACATDPTFAAPPELFTGRQQEIEYFQGILSRLSAEKEHLKCIIVHGPMGIGKSSLVRKMSSISRNHGCDFLIFVPSYENLVSFFDKISKDILSKLKSKHRLGEIFRKIRSVTSLKVEFSIFGPTLSLEKAQQVSMEAFCKRYKRVFVRVNEFLVREQKSLIVFIDQAERLMRETSSEFIFVEALLILLKKYCPRIMLGIALPTRFLSKMFERSPELKRLSYINEFELRPLSYDESLSLIERRSSFLGLKMNRLVIDDLIDYSKNSPYEIVRNFAKLVELSDGATIDETTWKRALPLMQKRYENLLSTLTNDELRATKSRINLPLEQTRRVLEILHEKGIIRMTDDRVSLFDDVFWGYLHEKAFAEKGTSALLESYLMTIKNLLESEQVALPLVKNVIKTLFRDFPQEAVILKKSFARIARTLIRNKKMADSMSLYETIIDTCLLSGMLNSATEWALEAIELFESESTTTFSLLFVEKLIDQVLYPCRDYRQIVKVCNLGLDIARKAQDYGSISELFLFLAKVYEETKSDPQKIADSYQNALENYLKAAEIDISKDSWKAIQEFQMANLINRNFISKGKITIGLEAVKDCLQKRGVDHFVGIVGIRGAGVYAITPSVVFSCLNQLPRKSNIVLLNLGTAYELTTHLSSFAFQYLPRELSLIGIMENKRATTTKELEAFRYDVLLAKQLFRIGGGNHETYMEKIRQISASEKFLYTIPLFCDDIKPNEFENFSQEVVINKIKAIADALKPAYFFITKPGFSKQGNFDELHSSSLIHKILDLVDDILLVVRGDTQENFDNYTMLAQAVCAKPAWSLKTHICINRWNAGVKIPDEFSSKVLFELPLLTEWGEAVEHDRIPYIELDLSNPVAKSSHFARALLRIPNYFVSRNALSLANTHSNKLVNQMGKTTLTDIPLQPVPEKKIMGKVQTGFKSLDQMLFGGIPENYAVALVSPSFDETTQIINRFLETGIRNEQVTFYITMNPRNINALSSNSMPFLYVFICSSKAQSNARTIPNVFNLSGVDNLTDVEIALTKVLRSLDSSQLGPKRACIDIISDVLLQHRVVTTRKWLNEILTILRSNGFTTLGVVNPQLHAPEETQAILGFFDGEVKIFEREGTNGVAKVLKIQRMHNQMYLEDELTLNRRETLT